MAPSPSTLAVLELQRVMMPMWTDRRIGQLPLVEVHAGPYRQARIAQVDDASWQQPVVLSSFVQAHRLPRCRSLRIATMRRGSLSRRSTSAAN